MNQPSPCLDVRTETGPGHALLSCRGRFDSLGAAAFERAVAGLPGQTLRVAVDLSGVDYLSSAGIRGLLTPHKALSARGGGLVLCAPAAFVRQVLEQAGLLAVFPLAEDPAAVLAGWAGPGGAASVDGPGRDPAASPDPGLARVAALDCGGSLSLVPLPGGGASLVLWGDFHADSGGPAPARLDELGLFAGRAALARDPDQAAGHLGGCLAVGHGAGVLPESTGLSDFLTSARPEEAVVVVAGGVSLAGAPSFRAEARIPGSCSLAGVLAGMFRAAGAAPLEDAPAPDGTVPGLGLVLFHRSGDRLFLTLGVAGPRQGPWPGDVRIPWRAWPGGLGLYAWTLDLAGTPWPLAPALGAGHDQAGGQTVAQALARACGLENLAAVSLPDPQVVVEQAGGWVFSFGRLERGEDRRTVVQADPGEFPPEWEPLVRQTCPGASRVRLTRLHGGYMSSTFLAEVADGQGRLTAPSVIKIGSAALTGREEEALNRYVRPFIPDVSPTLVGRGADGDWAAIRCSFVGAGNGTRLVWLEEGLHTRPAGELAGVFDRLYTVALNPWYGQPRRDSVRPYAEHDPLRLFPGIFAAADRELGLGPEVPDFPCPELGRTLPNPYRFLHLEYPRRRDRSFPGYRCPTHGDLNPRNVLLDGRDNLFVIDFSETAPRPAVADFARMEPILLLELTRVRDEGDAGALLRFMEAWTSARSLGETADPPVAGDDPFLPVLAVLLKRLRRYAGVVSLFDTDIRPYLLAVLEWTLCAVCYGSLDQGRKRLSACLAALLCEALERAGDPEAGNR